MSGARDLDFQAVSDLIVEVNFQIKLSTLSNRRRKEEKDNESNLNPIQDGLFQGHSQMGEGGGAKSPPSIKSVTHILQSCKLGSYTFTKGDPKNI